MKLSKSAKWRIALVLALVVVAGVVGSVLLGASDEGETITQADAAQMRDIVDQYWASIQHTWPDDLRGTKQRTLPQDTKAKMKEKRRAVAAKVATGELAEWEDGFDPGGFLEEMRSSGTVITGTGYRIVSMSEPVLISAGVAQSDVVIRDWSEQYEVDEDGQPAANPYRTENENTYRYTFEKVGGSWRIYSQDLVSNPLR